MNKLGNDLDSAGEIHGLGANALKLAINLFDFDVRSYGGLDIYQRVQETRTSLGEVTDEQMGHLCEDTLLQFIENNRALWLNAHVLDLGCGDGRTKAVLKKSVPTAQYTGVDVLEGEGIDKVSDARKPLPFEDDQFDVIAALGFMPEGMIGLRPGNIKHWKKPLRPNGHLVATCMTSFIDHKRKWFRTISKAFEIVQEQRFEFTYGGMPLDHTYVVAKNTKG